MKYALIGCGRISVNHVAAAKMNNLDLVAICDIDKSKMVNIKEKFELDDSVKMYESYEDLIENETPELVAIATESGKHAKIAKFCIKKRVNVIIEKPIALSLKDADEIVKLSQEYNVKVCACHQNRFNKSIQKIRSQIDKNSFGKIFHAVANIRWNRGKDYYTQAPWRGTWEQDGGALMNQCIHNIDLLRWMMGDEIDYVFGVTDNLSHPFIDAEDLGIAIIKFKNGSYGIIEGTTNIYPKNFEETLYLFGEKGTVKAGGKSVNAIDEWMFSDDTEDPEEVKKEFSENPPNVYGYGHNPLYADVIDAIKNNRQPYVDALAGRRALELVLAIYKSSSSGEKVKFPLNDCSSMDFKGLFDK